MLDQPILDDYLEGGPRVCPHCGGGRLLVDSPREGGTVWYLCPRCDERMSVPPEDDDERIER